MIRPAARRLPFALLALALGLLGVWAGAAVASGESATPDPLSDARRAASEQSFSGVVVVQWRDGNQLRSQEVRVTSERGAISVDGGRHVVARGSQRLVRDPNGGWLLLWDRSIPTTLPAPSSKYSVAEQAGPVVAGRTTREVVLVAGGRVRERIFLDASTNLLLRRERLDQSGRLVRAVTFRSFALGEPTTRSTDRDAVARKGQDAPDPLRTVGSPYHAPRRVGDGYVLVGAYEMPDAGVQLFYSDGLSTLSVFEREGALDESGLPAGGRDVTLGGRDAHLYVSPVGVAAVWAGDRVVYTAVTDASVQDLGKVVAAFPVTDDDSTLGRVGRFLLAPFSVGG